MFFLVLNSISAVPSYSPSSESVGRMWRSTSPSWVVGVAARRAAAEHLVLGEELLVDLEPADEPDLGVVQVLIQAETPARAEAARTGRS